MLDFCNKYSGGGLRLTGSAVLAVMVTACGGQSGGEGSSSSSSSSSSGGSSSSSSSSSGEPVAQPYDHCTSGGFRPDTTNGSITDGPTVYTSPSGVKGTTVHPTVYEYMYDNAWQDAHVLWHNVRACGALFGETPRPDLPDACDDIMFQPEETTCEGDQDGLEFLAGHRLMMDQLKELWPDHTEQFTGWGQFPSVSDYPDILVSEGHVRQWTQEELEAAAIGDNIEDNMHLFENEGQLGTWLQCGGTPGGAGSLGGFAGFGGGVNLHITLHGNGSPGMNQPHSVNNNNQNLDSYLFWKLHGWIDQVWERYRAAQGKTRADDDYKQEMLNQCREMDHWRDISLASRDPDGNGSEGPDTNPLPEEAGFFHEVVRPAIEDAGCLSCHGDIQSNNDLQLGGLITSTEIVENLLGDAVMVANYQYVVPNNASESWLYLKASGDSANSGADCTSGLNCLSPMPNGGTVAPVIREWIEDHDAERPTFGF